MGIDTWMAATPAPHYLDGTIDHPLSDAGAAVLRQRVKDAPAHVIHATGIVQHNDGFDPDDAHAWTYSLLENAIDESLAGGIGCAVVTAERAWVVGGGMDDGPGIQWSEQIAALALTGVTELALDAGPRRVAPSVKEARALARRPDVDDHLVAVARDLLRRLDCTPHQVRTIGRSVGDLLDSKRPEFIDVLALTLRSRWVTW